MRAAGKNIIVIFSCIGLFSFAWVYLYGKYAAAEREEYIGYDELKHFGMDELDYHFLATNFALANKFPVTGFILPTAVYRIKSNEEMDLIYLDMFKRNGPVTSFMRPPLVPLLVGCMYKVFGYKYYYNLRLNVFLLALIIGFMPLAGFSNWGLKGYFSGTIGALIFLKSTHDSWFLHTMGMDVFSAFSFFMVVAVGLWVERKELPFSYMLWGFSIGFSLLVKPFLVPFLVIIAAYTAFKYRKRFFHFGAKRLLALFMGILLVVLPWAIYANHIQRETRTQRETWCNKVLAHQENLQIADINDLVLHPSDTFSSRDPKYDLTIRYFKNIVGRLWPYHSRTTPFIFITNSFGDEFLNLNNEYCNDINFHYEWRYIQSSFYRSHCTDGQSAIVKMMLFYWHNPSFLFRIPVSRLLYPLSADYHRYYWLSASLWALCVLQLHLYTVRSRKMKLILTSLLLITVLLVFIFSFYFSRYAVLLLFTPLLIVGFLLFKRKYQNPILTLFPLLWLGLFIAIFFMVPNTRYMLIAMPVSCLCIIYFSLLLINGFKGLALGSSIGLYNQI